MLHVLRSILVVLAMFVLTIPLLAQESTCYTEAIKEIQALIDAEVTLQELEESIVTLAETCQPESDGKVLYSVSANSAVNLRGGPGTDHDVVGRSTAGQTFEVYGETQGNQYTWLEIVQKGEPAYIAGSLTTRLPDFMLEEEGDAITLDDVSCGVDHSARRDSRTTVQVVEYGDSVAEFDVTRMSDNAIMRLLRSDYDSQTNGTYYRYGWQSSGIYTLSISVGRKSESVGFEIEGTKTHFIRVNCG